MALESKIQKKILQFLKAEGCFCYKHIATNINGIPDVFFISPNGYGIFCEIKQEKGKLSELQKYQMNRINTSNAKYIKAVVVYSFEEFQKFYNNLLNY